jgi:hypothetical protein
MTEKVNLNKSNLKIFDLVIKISQQMRQFWKGY